MVLKANDRRTSCPCHDEFRGPRFDYVRQVALENNNNNNRFFCHCCCGTLPKVLLSLLLALTQWFLNCGPWTPDGEVQLPDHQISRSHSTGLFPLRLSFSADWCFTIADLVHYRKLVPPFSAASSRWIPITADDDLSIQQKGVRCFPFETGIHYRRKTDFFPEEETTMSYSGFEPEPTRLQAEGHGPHTGWATRPCTRI
ncbi:hypothetical protein TNCV_779011 [Trichonephila clavipes]|nr:hypothetical protein TNCV_779011 [Trichonephila clavipes]